MGSFFSNILIQNTNGLDALKENVCKVLTSMGFAHVDAEATQDGSICAFGNVQDRFVTLVLDVFDDENVDAFCMDLAKRLAKEQGGYAVAMQCIDSDVLLLSLTKGSTVSMASIGDGEVYGIDPSECDDVLWKELISNATDWAAFESMRKEEYIFAEEMLYSLSDLLGFSARDAVRYWDDEGEPLIECSFKKATTS